MRDLNMQRAVLALVLREHPILLTLPALAGRVLANPRTLTGGSRWPAPSAILTTRAWSSATGS
jgi:hypothetical protein